jgi:hypothetical protein
MTARRIQGRRSDRPPDEDEVAGDDAGERPAKRHQGDDVHAAAREREQADQGCMTRTLVDMAHPWLPPFRRVSRINDDLASGA